ncbi:MAG: hypothetical protein UV60_C0046G0008 [Parcubacteria group bacterium GW2011_GWA2_43_11]|nr:MAG: hypothetical protein UV60_C0046G0008 [Parcubacteria group bacterium GW2011_GWA2_43_11]
MNTKQIIGAGMLFAVVFGRGWRSMSHWNSIEYIILNLVLIALVVGGCFFLYKGSIEKKSD